MATTLRTSAQAIQGLLEGHGLTTQVVEFQELTRTSEEAARVIGCEVGQIAKTLIFCTKTTKRPVCVIASGINRIDEKKIQHLIGEAIERPDADFVLKHTGFAIGGIPPIGFTFEMAPFIDPDLMAYNEVWAAAGTPFAVFKISPKDLVRITNGQIVEVKK